MTWTCCEHHRMIGCMHSILRQVRNPAGRLHHCWIHSCKTGCVTFNAVVLQTTGIFMPHACAMPPLNIPPNIYLQVRAHKMCPRPHHISPSVDSSGTCKFWYPYAPSHARVRHRLQQGIIPHPTFGEHCLVWAIHVATHKDGATYAFNHPLPFHLVSKAQLQTLWVWVPRISAVLLAWAPEPDPCVASATLHGVLSLQR